MPIEDANFYSRSFSKKERICSKKVLLQLILNKKTLFCYPFKCYYQIEENTSANTLHEIAVAVPKKKNSISR